MSSLTNISNLRTDAAVPRFTIRGRKFGPSPPAENKNKVLIVSLQTDVYIYKKHLKSCTRLSKPYFQQ